MRRALSESRKDDHGRNIVHAGEAAHGLAGDEVALGLGGSGAALMRWRSEGVSTVPGQRALQRSPCFTKSAATALVRPITAALVVP